MPILPHPLHGAKPCSDLPEALAQLASFARDPKAQRLMPDAKQIAAQWAARASEAEIIGCDLPRLFHMLMGGSNRSALPAVEALIDAGQFWKAGPWSKNGFLWILMLAKPQSARKIALDDRFFESIFSQGAGSEPHWVPKRPSGLPQPAAWESILPMIEAAGDPSEIVAQMEPMLLTWLARNGKLSTWGLCCMIAKRPDLMKKALKSGLDLSSMPESARSSAFMELATLSNSNHGRQDFPRPRPSWDAQGIAAEALRSKQCWQIAIKAGMGPASIPAHPLDEPANRLPTPTASALPLLEIEAKRGACLDANALPLWGQAQMSWASLREKPDLFQGLSPLAWAFSKAGMDKDLWSVDIAHGCLANAHGHQESLLRALAEAGVDWRSEGPKAQRFPSSTMAWQAAKGWAVKKGSEGIAEPASEFGATILALGIDLGAQDKGGSGLIESLLAQGRAAASPELAASIKALLDLAEAGSPGAAQKMIAMRGKDRSGPMHWAARCLNTQCIELFAQLGLSVNDADAKGRTPARCIAGAEGSSGSLLPGFKALDALGADWSAKDGSGQTPLSMLAAKAPLKQLREIVAIFPKLMLDGDSSTGFFANIAQRGSAALTMMESAALSAATPSAPKSKRASL